MLKILLAIACSSLLVCGQPAQAEPPSLEQAAGFAAEQVLPELDEALEAVDAAPAAVNSRVELPANGQRTVRLEGTTGDISMTLPLAEAVTDEGLTRVFEGRVESTLIAVSPTRDGMRAALSLSSADAPDRHRFKIGGDVERLVLDEEGNVHAFSADGTYLATAEQPWAVDAVGRMVPTWYEVSGTTLVQVVAHNSGSYAYPITADPAWLPAAGAAAAAAVARASWVLIRECSKYRACQYIVIRGLGTLTAVTVERVAASASLKLDCWNDSRGLPPAKTAVKCIAGRR